MQTRTGPAILALAALVLTLAAPRIVAAQNALPAAAPTFPLKASANNRYLVDQNGEPFLMAGDSPQSLIGRLSTNGAAAFMKNRAFWGINTLWINLLCDSYTACNADGTTFDGLAPFTVAGDLSKPNPAYFQRAEDMLNLAAAQGMVVLLDPIETGGWLGVLEANGLSKAYAYGRYLGNRFKNVPNIIWMHGNDFQSWRNSSDNDLVIAVARGIKQTDPNHLQTAELDYYVSGTLDDSALRPFVGLDAAYTYRPTYDKVLIEYRRTKFMPVFMVEANYEFEQNGGTDGGSTANLRHQEYWTMLSGATGQLYGSSYTWRLPDDWASHLNTPGIKQFRRMNRLFANRRWYDLIPDDRHQVVTAGRGVYSKDDSITTDTYATAASTADGKLVMAYMPNLRTLTVDMTKLAGRAGARWYDPANGRFVAISGAPFSNTASRRFRPPGNNSAGDGDWVLLLEVP